MPSRKLVTLHILAVSAVLLVNVLALPMISSDASAQQNSDSLTISTSQTLPDFTFENIDGGEHLTADWRGKPVLLINSASRCGYTKQYASMQELHEAYSDRGLVVLALPSDDFRQELDSAEDVKDFCEVNFGLTLPMTGIVHVKGDEAHPFYAWMKYTHGWEPNWNFNKVLIGSDGSVKGTWRSRTRPDDPEIIGLIEQDLS